jgi:hypothetical protein
MHTLSDHSEPERGANGSAFLDHCRNVARCHDGFAALMEEDDRDHVAFVGELLERRSQITRGNLSMGGFPESEMSELAIAVAAGLPEASGPNMGPQASAMHMLLQKLVDKDSCQIMELLRSLDAPAEQDRPAAEKPSAREKGSTAHREFRQRAFVLGEFYGQLANFLDDAREVDMDLYAEQFFDFQNAHVSSDESPAPAVLSVVAGIHEDNDRTPKEASLFAIASVAKQLSVEDLARLAREAKTLADRIEARGQEQ